MKNIISFISLVLFTVFTLKAQVSGSPQTSENSGDALECGFIATQSQLDNLENNPEYQSNKINFIDEYKAKTFNRSSGQMALSQIDWVPIKAHITRTSTGTGGLTTTQLTAAIDSMNNYYINANMQFYLCGGINYIDNNTYYNFNSSDETVMHAAHGQANLINIYFCNTVSSGTSNLCGYAYYPGGPDVILMANSCAINGSTLAHEMGHFYSLRHTHGGSNGTLTSELVNGSNCSSAGDFVCDTDADPQLGNSNVSSSCVYNGTAPYTGGVATDANGTAFTPNPNNIMSYSRKSCRDFFSVGQFARINAAHKTSRNYFTCATFNVDFSATLTTSCVTPLTVSFTDNSTGATSWQWDVDGDSVIDYTTQNPSHTYTTAGSYDVSLTISNGTTVITKTKIGFIIAGAKSIPYNQDFETFITATNATGLLEGWTTNPVNTTTAYRWNVDDGGTVTGSTGPFVDNTLATSAGHYMHIEASQGSQNDVAELISPCISLNAGSPELSFAYHMHGSSMGELHLDIFSGGVWTNDIMTALVGQQTINQSDAFSIKTVDLSTWAGEVIELRFRGIRNSSFRGDIAIDDINIKCIPGTNPNPSANFTSSTTNTFTGDPVMFSDASSDAIAWKWNFGTGASPTIASGAGPHNVTYSSTGLKTVSLIAFGDCSSDTTNTSLNIGLVGVTENEFLTYFTVYPNPVNSSLSIKTNIIYSRVQIINVVGQIVIESNGNSTIDMSELESGNYIIQLIGEESQIIRSEKFTKN